MLLTIPNLDNLGPYRAPCAKLLSEVNTGNKKVLKISKKTHRRTLPKSLFLGWQEVEKLVCSTLVAQFRAQISKFRLDAGKLG